MKLQTLVPEFAVEDLPSAELQPRFLRLQWRSCPWAEHSDDDDDDDNDYLNKIWRHINGHGIDFRRILKSLYLLSEFYDKLHEFDE